MQQSLSLPITPTILQDFDSFTDAMFRLMTEQLGFQSPQLYLKQEQNNALILVKPLEKIEVSLDNTEDPIVRSFTTGIIIETDQIHIPIKVFGQSIGVIVLSQATKSVLSEQEKQFLQNLLKQISPHIFTTWSLKHSDIEKQKLKQKTEEFAELINIKKQFLHDIQEVLLRVVKEGNPKQELREQLLESLMYLNSVLLLSESKIADKK